MKEKKQKEPGAEMQEVLTEEQLKKRKLHRARVSLGCMVLILAVGVVGNWYWENSDISTKISTVSAQRTKTLGVLEVALQDSVHRTATLPRLSWIDKAVGTLRWKSCKKSWIPRIKARLPIKKRHRRLLRSPTASMRKTKLKHW